MPKKGETKHEAFLRLAQKRLNTTGECHRLISQLSGKAYENTQEEAEEIVHHLSSGVKHVADAFGVTVKFTVGQESLLETQVAQSGPVNVIDVARAIEHIQEGNTDEALQGLKTALSGAAR